METQEVEVLAEVGVATIYEIEVGDRFRVDFGDLDKLASSMRTNGIIAPLAVKRGSELPSCNYKLLAGGRRFAAALKGGIEKLLVRIYPDDITEDQMIAIELEENLERKDFTVEEVLKGTKALHDAQVKIHGLKTARTADAPGWSQSLTAELLGKSNAEISLSLKLARAAEKHPEIAKAANMQEANKLLKKIESNKEKTVKAQKVKDDNAGVSEEDAKKKLMLSYRIQDCIVGMSALPPETFDIAEIDPPYAIDFRELKMGTKSSGSTTLDYNEIPANEYENFMLQVIQQAYRVLKKDSWLVLWHADNWRSMLTSQLEAQGFYVRTMPALWVKCETSSQTMQPKRFLAHNYECFLYACKGNAEIQTQGRNDTFLFKGVPSNYRSHPTERPVRLIQEIIKTFVPLGGKVIVPFAGSGNTLLAANNLLMEGIGFDLSEQYRDNFLLNAHEGELHNYKSKGVE